MCKKSLQTSAEWNKKDYTEDNMLAKLLKHCYKQLQDNMKPNRFCRIFPDILYNQKVAVINL